MTQSNAGANGPDAPLASIEQVASTLVAGEAVRFDDLAPEEMIAFLDAARQHSEVDPTSREEYSGFVDLAAMWGCTKCGSEHSLEDTLVAAGVPQCPKLRGFGLGRRRPKAQGHLTGPGVERE